MSLSHGCPKRCPAARARRTGPATVSPACGVTCRPALPIQQDPTSYSSRGRQNALQEARAAGGNPSKRAPNSLVARLFAQGLKAAPPPIATWSQPIARVRAVAGGARVRSKITLQRLFSSSTSGFVQTTKNLSRMPPPGHTCPHSQVPCQSCIGFYACSITVCMTQRHARARGHRRAVGPSHAMLPCISSKNSLSTSGVPYIRLGCRTSPHVVCECAQTRVEASDES